MLMVLTGISFKTLKYISFKLGRRKMGMKTGGLRHILKPSFYFI
jgi:hypothetical protein